jgi:hypothetical protein
MKTFCKVSEKNKHLSRQFHGQKKAKKIKTPLYVQTNICYQLGSNGSPWGFTTIQGLKDAWDTVYMLLGSNFTNSTNGTTITMNRLWNSAYNLDKELWAPGEAAKAAADPEELGCVSCDKAACYATSCQDDTVGPQLCGFSQHPPFLSLRGLCQYSYLGNKA